MIETTIGAQLVDGKVKGGAKSMVCALCLMQGKRLVVV